MRFSKIPGVHSVRASILVGFTALILILAVSIGGAVYTVVQYREATGEMQKRANVASELQKAEANGSVAALLLQRMVAAGDMSLTGEIRIAAGAAVQSMNNAVALETAVGQSGQASLARMQTVADSSASLTAAANQVMELAAAGELETAAATMEEIVPVFREFRLELIDIANNELAEVDRLETEANEAGNLAVTLMIISGVVGAVLAIAIAFVISRSIIKPLSRLEKTALSVALGDTSARAPVGGPRELKRLAESLNLMTATAHQRTDELRLSNEELRERNRQLLDARYQAATDPLTGLLNHRTFHEQIRTVTADRLQNGGNVSVIMIDIDNFKRVNDSLGHMAGDHVLLEIAATIADVCGDQNAYRYGGDEFAILLPDAGREKAFSIADRILKAVKTRVRSENGDKATISLGVASFPDMARSAEELLYRADIALNWAKARGKNRIGGWDQVEEDERMMSYSPHQAMGRGLVN